MRGSTTWAWLFVAMVACGGKTTADGSPTITGALPADAPPPPTCSTICDRLVTLCAGSPNASCNADCESTKAKYAKCAGELDRFLRCMGTTHVECTPGEVVVIDCSDERVALEHCGQ